MKRILIILILIPFLSFSQSGKEYERVISISDFLNEFYYALDNNKDIEFRNTQVIFLPEIDNDFLVDMSKKYVRDLGPNKHRKEIWTNKYTQVINSHLILKELQSIVEIEQTDIKNYYCNIEGGSSNSSINIENCDFKCNIGFSSFNSICIKNSSFQKLDLFGSSFNSIIAINIVANEIVSKNSHIETLNIIGSKISNISIGDHQLPSNAQISSIRIESSEVNKMNVSSTIFINKFNSLCRYSENDERILIENSFIDICNSKIQEFNWEQNATKDEDNINDSLFFSYINGLESEGHSILSSYKGKCTSYSWTGNEIGYMSKENIDLYIEKLIFY